jgi:hypothetical protein
MSHAPQFIQSQLNPETLMMTPEQFELVKEYAKNFDPSVMSANAILGDEAEYLARVQAVLDENWPGTTDMVLIRGGDSHVYSAMYNGEEVIVKSTLYLAGNYAITEGYKDFLNFVNEEVPVAYFIEPGVAKSDDSLPAFKQLTVTMSDFASGQSPKEVGPDAPYTWIFDEAAVKAQGDWLGRYRSQSIKYKQLYP